MRWKLYTLYDSKTFVGEDHIVVRTNSGMVVDERKRLPPISCKREKLRRGESDNPTPMFLSVLSQVYITLNHSEQSKSYLSSCEVFINGMLRAVRLLHWTMCQIWSAC
jgi:hypothetical protein